ncbi:MAG TPA: ferredoxin, partial [Methanosarcina sp.]|nr:ferredoxin [Methanosarcina sp.]
MSEEKQEKCVCQSCCEETETKEPKCSEPSIEELEAEEPEPAEPESSEAPEENPEKITVTNSMDIQGSHFLYTQGTE